MAKIIPGWAASLFLLAPSAVTYAADNTQIEYQVPAGFSEAEQDKSMQFLATLDGKALPGPIIWSAQKNHLIFDETLYRQNGVSAEQIVLLNKVLTQIPYAVCPNGCDYTVSGQTVSLDKVKQSLTITDGKQRYVQPQTMMGFIHNQSLDVRTASNEYRAVSAYGQGSWGYQHKATAISVGSITTAGILIPEPPTKASVPGICRKISPQPTCVVVVRTAVITPQAVSVPP